MAHNNVDSPSSLFIENAAKDTFSVHWSAVFAGGFVTALTYLILMSLGLAIGADTVRNVIQGDQSITSVGVGSGIWTVVTVLISLFIGSYASGRVSGIIATRIGYTQGAVISSIFFIAMLTQIGMTLGSLGRGLGALTSTGVNSAAQVAQNPSVIAIVEDSMSDMHFRDPANVVLPGVVSRLVRGDSNSAITFLAVEAQIPRAEAQARIDQARAKFDAVVREAGDRAAKAVAAVGWSAFVSMTLGTLCAMLGGATGALVNIRKPIDSMDRRAIRRQQAYT